jgi:hypothetical protein
VGCSNAMYARSKPDKVAVAFFMLTRLGIFYLSFRETLGLKLVTAGYHGSCDRIKTGAALISASLSHTHNTYVHHAAARPGQAAVAG